MSKLLPIETKNDQFGLYLYPEANKIRKTQLDMTWTDEEIKVEKDKQDYKQNMSDVQVNGVSYTLDNFIEIEQTVGDVWEQISSWFPHSEIEGACSVISSMEKSVHAFFYQKMNDTLNIDPEQTAKNREVILPLKNKLSMIKDVTSNLSHNKPLSLGTLAFIEQVLLFSNFGFLKSFKANGNNYMPTTLTGVDYVINDEVLHGTFASYLHNTYISEYKEVFGSFDMEQHKSKLVEMATLIIRHEDASIEYIFKDSDSINDVTAEQLKIFIRSRVNMVMLSLGFEAIYKVENNPIAEWFYQGANSIKIHDAFSAGTNQYSRSWSLDAFSRIGEKTNVE